MNYHAKQIKAIKLAIESLERERRKLYATGCHAYCKGIRTDKLNSAGVVGNLFSFAEDGYKSYKEYTDAINELNDLIEVLEDPGVKHSQQSMFSQP